MEQKENQRITVTKRMLKEGMLRLMETKPLPKISVSELCRVSGINRVTFYNHYDAPADILAEIGDDMVHDIQSLLKEKQLRSHATLQERVEYACEYLKQNEQTAKLIFQNNTPESEFAAKLFRGQEEWKIASDELTSAYGEDGKDLFFTFMIHGAYCMIAKWLLDDVKKTPKEMGRLISEISINGLTI